MADSSLAEPLLLEKKEVIKTVPNIPAKTRLECLDIYRGLTMVGMILVDNRGNPEHVIWPLDETSWNGLSTADCVFPSFLFISGVAITLALKPQANNKKEQLLRVFERSLKLFAIGLLLNVCSSNFKEHFRIMGVLQRISLCYFATSVSYLMLPSFLYQAILHGIYLFIYIFFMYSFDVPDGCGPDNVTPTCNFGQYFDRQIITYNYMMKPTDPEGLFTTLGAFCTTFLGVCYGLIMQEFKANKKQLSLAWLFTSIVISGFGVVTTMTSSVNKIIWTPAFVFIVGGMSGLFLNICFVVVDILQNKKVNKYLQWLKWLGLNPLFIFVAMIWLEVVMMVNVRFYVDDEKWTYWNFLSNYAFSTWLINEDLSSLVVSIVHLGLWVAVAYYLFVKKIFIKL